MNATFIFGAFCFEYINTSNGRLLGKAHTNQQNLPPLTRLCRISKRSEDCGENAKVSDAMRDESHWIAISCATARTTVSVHAAPYPSVNAEDGQ